MVAGMWHRRIGESELWWLECDIGESENLTLYFSQSGCIISLSVTNQDALFLQQQQQFQMSDLRIWLSENLRIWLSENVRIWLSENLIIWLSENVRIWLSENVRIWLSENVRIWLSENLIIWLSENLRIWLSENLTFGESENLTFGESENLTFGESDFQTVCLWEKFEPAFWTWCSTETMKEDILENVW